MSNIRLAQFITSFGGLNSYGSTVAQTKKALDNGTPGTLSNSNDEGLFRDALSGINAILKYGFTVQGIIAVNQTFTHNEEEDPSLPGHLRNSMYNAEDNISISVSPDGRDYYFPPEQVNKSDLKEIIDTFHQSKQTRLDGLRVFADLAKLQPFQDGNKRTALIAANAALNTWQTEAYLLIPLNSLDQADFMINLMRYYQTDSESRKNDLLLHMAKLMPNVLEQEATLPKENSPEIDRLKTARIKPIFKKKQKSMRR